MNLTRLMALGTLASHGPQHGHQIRRTAEVTNVSEWGGVSVGALYRELRQMAGEGLVTELRTEQVGRRPARTVYAITDQGRLELGTLREQAIRDLKLPPDPLGVALTFSGTGEDPEQFTRWMTARRDKIAVALREVSADREQLTAKGYITPLVASVMRRSELALEAELRWHEELTRALGQEWPTAPGAPLGLPPGLLAADGAPARADRPAGADPASTGPAGAGPGSTGPASTGPAGTGPADSGPAASQPPGAE
jgi:DNA-binding PadR family transcriptional regulator